MCSHPPGWFFLPIFQHMRGPGTYSHWVLAFPSRLLRPRGGLISHFRSRSGPIRPHGGLISLFRHRTGPIRPRGGLISLFRHRTGPIRPCGGYYLRSPKPKLTAKNGNEGFVQREGLFQQCRNKPANAGKLLSANRCPKAT